MPGKVPRIWFLAASFLLPGAAAVVILLLAPDQLWFLLLSFLAWGVLFMYWAYRKLKDPRYYG